MRISYWSSDVCSSDLEQADRPRAFFAVEIVADDRNRSRTDDGFADPETQAQHEQKGEGGGETAAHGHRAPDDDAADQQIFAVGPISVPAKRNADKNVKQRKGGPEQQADLKVIETHRRLDRLDNQREDVAIEIGQDEDEQQ